MMPGRFSRRRRFQWCVLQYAPTQGIVTTNAAHHNQNLHMVHKAPCWSKRLAEWRKTGVRISIIIILSQPELSSIWRFLEHSRL